MFRAEADLRLLVSGQFFRNEMSAAIAVKRQLRSILQNDPGSPFRFQIEQDLFSVGEILAKHDLAIASYYLQRGIVRGSTKGAEGRLLQITREYPGYSKMDEVLLKLADISVRDERPDDASAYLRKLLSDYPLSDYAGAAFEKLNLIGVAASQASEKSEHP